MNDWVKHKRGIFEGVFIAFQSIRLPCSPSTKWNCAIGKHRKLFVFDILCLVSCAWAHFLCALCFIVVYFRPHREIESEIFSGWQERKNQIVHALPVADSRFFFFHHHRLAFIWLALALPLRWSLHPFKFHAMTTTDQIVHRTLRSSSEKFSNFFLFPQQQER